MTKEQRSRTMARIRSKNTSIEHRFKMAMAKIGLRGWRMHDKESTADFCFPKERIAIFLDGCFWHGCPVHYRPPKSNKKFWTSKVKRNMRRDREITEKLESQGWIVLRIWEHELHNFQAALAKAVWISSILSRRSYGETNLVQDIR